MEEKASGNDQTLKVSRYNRDMAVLTQRVSQLNITLERVRSQQRTDSVALNIIKRRFPKEYWAVVNGLKDEYAKAGRLISGEHGALGKAYSEILERDGYRCARCNAPPLGYSCPAPATNTTDSGLSCATSRYVNLKSKQSVPENFTFSQPASVGSRYYGQIWAVYQTNVGGAWYEAQIATAALRSV